MNKEKAAFHRGMLAALQHVATHDFETLYREIVESTDVDELVQVAREDGQMTMSGLKRYGYGRAHPLPSPPDPSLREQLIVAIAQALRENTDMNKAPAEIYPSVVQSSGLRRAVWSALTSTQQRKLVGAAIKLARGT